MREKRSSLSYVLITLKGMAMGAADVVPGVSGGTIAFITNIYEELIETIAKLDFGFFKVWKNQSFSKAFKEYNLAFLFALLGGVVLSILSLAKLITFLLDTYPLLLWAFFFGLIVASIHYVGKQITQWSLGVFLIGILGIAISYYVTIAEPLQSTDSYGYIFISGFLAIIAMILPGLSGAFILLLLGSYTNVLGIIENLFDGIINKDFETLKTAISKIVVFILGCIIGLKAFSKALNFLFKSYQNLTLAILTGFMIGALNKVWPWKEVLSYRTNSHGEKVPLVEQSILPHNFDGDPQILWVIVLSVIGFLTIFLLEKIADTKKAYAD